MLMASIRWGGEQTRRSCDSIFYVWLPVCVVLKNTVNKLHTLDSNYIARLVTYLLLYIFQYRGYFNQISNLKYSKYGSERLYDGYSN